MKTASFESISSGTMRPEDLLATFADELEDLVRRNAEHFCSDAGRAQRDAFLNLAWNAREALDEDDVLVEDGAHDPDELLSELFDALEYFAPPYAYFGSHSGDGADFGFWLTDDLEGCFDGLKVGDTSEVPDDYTGEVLHVNDHGNCTLYSADKGNLTEIWALV